MNLIHAPPARLQTHIAGSPPHDLLCDPVLVFLGIERFGVLFSGCFQVPEVNWDSINGKLHAGEQPLLVDCTATLKDTKSHIFAYESARQAVFHAGLAQVSREVFSNATL
jgi:hypothetical protein